MIQESIEFSAELLNQFLKNKFSSPEGKVIINNIIQSDGSLSSKNRNKVVISLINVSKETQKNFYNKPDNPVGDQPTIAPIERYNVDILVTSSFDRYRESLKFLNASILFFQINPVISVSSNSDIPEGIDRLDFQLEHISYFEMHSLWSAMGAKYQPSVIYKVRLLTSNRDNTEQSIPSI
ncbi:Pvc16 family protein [Winogradskyella sp. 3972H.M.0a.05]|uniref:DUF4255 domain-containing protein n=1 Tax=Winogradskyella sp. 3972H.M.0a.05 TaxID=2950277 RepID=UPI003392F7D7